MSVTTIDDYGAIGNGIANDSAAIAAMDADPAQPYVVLGNGNYLVAASLTIGKRVKKYGTGFFNLPTGVVLTLSKQFSAERELCFSCTGTGKVVFTIQPLMGFPEWWGAVVGGADCLDAINRSIVACSITDLAGNADYYVSNTVLLQTANRKIRGAVKSWAGVGGSRLMINDANATGVLMGLSSNPTGAIANNLPHVYLEDLTVTRSVQIGTGTARGIENKWTVFSGALRCEFMEHKVGYYFSGTVQPHLNHCMSARYGVGSSPSTDQFYGYYFDGASGLAAAGGNASVYITECTALCILTAAQCPKNVGFGLTGPSADTFIHRNEVTGCRQAFVVIGGTSYSGDADIHITENICDGLQYQGCTFLNLNSSSVVHHSGNYYAPASGATFAAIVVSNCSGSIYSAGNQVVGWPGTTTGISVGGGTGFTSQGDMLLDCVLPCQLDATQAFEVAPICVNNNKVAPNGAIYITGNSNRGRVSPSVRGQTATFSSGVNIAVGTMIEVNVTKIIPGAVTNKLVIAGSAVTTTGIVGSHLVTGLF